MIDRYRSSFLAGLAAIAIAAPATPAAAQSLDSQHAFNIPEQAVADALLAFSRQSNVQIVTASANISNRRSHAVSGTMAARAALDLLLADTGLSWRQTGRGSIVVEAAQPGEPNAGSAAAGSESAEIVVTGSRIAGAPSASPTILVGREDIIRSGQASLGDVIRSLPQNFGGGQNPGLSALIPLSSGENVASGSSFDLRGLGTDATLVLLNGQRLVYGSNRQSIDVGAIPVEAIDRIEIVTDGTSAIYGSDAVAGVANIVLRRDYDGVSTSARLGAATEGGFEQQRYTMVAGQQWSDGGVVATYEFARETSIESSQRSYTRAVNPGLTLFPSVKRHDLVASLHQSLTPSVELRLDGLYNWRADRRYALLSTAGNGLSTRVGGASWMMALAPSIDWRIDGNWRLRLSGTYGLDRTRYGSDQSTGGPYVPSLRGCYCNQAYSAELGATGTLLPLPGGILSAALGGGFRHNAFRSLRTLNSPLDLRTAQNAYYVYGELSAPLVSPDQHVPGMYRLTLNGALRYEDFPDVGNALTPKLGVVYSPIEDIDLRATWGRSFKAPTLFQRFNSQIAILYPAAARGGIGYSPNATILELDGGNAALKPERATTWTASIVLTPRAISGLRFEVSYFDISFRNRIVIPIDALPRTLSDPVYAGFVTLNPTNAAIADALVGRGFYDLTGAGFDPATVVAISDNRSQNVARQKVSGIDVNLDFERELGAFGAINARLAATYLDSAQQNVPGQPFRQLSGTYYNPAKYRLHASLGWHRNESGITLSADYISGVRDTRYVPAEPLEGMTTFDLNVRHGFTAPDGPLHGVSVALSVLNILDQHPPYSRPGAIYDPSYDTSNYSPLGRFVAVDITKRW